ncbi:MAG: phosphatase PAP2 family protein, partial [Thermodesulfovibrionales bacterium]|nr:phosphatase PAP2 family protein [Thermodesulfovibrionales bacterium]
RNLLNAIEGMKRDAFPSGHTGISLLLLILSWSYARRLFWIFLIITIGLLIATVYFRYHYVVDLLGGVVLTVVTIIIGKVYYLAYNIFYDKKK